MLWGFLKKMSKFGGLGSGSAMGLAGMVVVGAVLAAFYFRTETPPEPVAPPVAETAQVPAPMAPEPVVTPPMPTPPAIDTFRLEPDGQMIVAGQAAPGWDVSILLDDVNVSSVLSDSEGKFVQFLDLPTSTEPRILSLKMRSVQSGEEVFSQDEVIIAPTPEVVSEAVQTTGVAQTTEDVRATEAVPVSEPQSEPQLTVPQSESLPQASQTPTPQTVLLSDETGVRVLQSPSSDPAPEVMANVALDAITYSQDGEVELSGRAQGAGFVRIYLDNDPIATSPITPAGEWNTELPQVDTGVYTLRVDEVDAEGAVTSRVETPFKREDQSVLVDAQTTEVGRIRAVTVQPGSTLWAISREAYGEGLLYVRVYEANRDRIRNPDLIYPGQVFNLPQ